MKGNHHKPDRNEPEDELESLLKRLKPSPLDVGQMDGLCRGYERVATAQANAPRRIQWKRLIPLVAACGLVMCAVALYQFGFRFTRGIPAEQAPPTLASPSSLTREKPDATPVPTDPTNSLTSDTLSHRFIPISSRGVLINSSSQGVIETKNGLREKLHLEFEDTYHWHDPGTGTNVRIFSPRSEELTVPLESY